MRRHDNAKAHRLIDLHAHLLPGVDDGPATLEESLAILRAAVEDGTTTIAATSHVSRSYPTSPATIFSKLSALQKAAEQARIPIRILSGAEIALDQVATMPVDDLRRLCVGGDSGYVLIEFPYDGWPLELIPTLELVRVAGLRTVLAHPERNDEVRAFPARLEALVADGALVQLTAGAITGEFGRGQQRTARELLDLGFAHLLASDTHGRARGYGLRTAAEALGDSSLARWLTVDVPGAIAGGVIPPLAPPRPAVRRRRLLFRGRGG
jgi:protein-tyrosine phosphatase